MTVLSQNPKNIDNQKQPETGRSLVELLGVLAVMGVLSIAGIAGYTFAMNKYQANKIMNELNILSNEMAMAINKIHSSDYHIILGSPYDNQQIITGGYTFYFGCVDEAKEESECYTEDTTYYQRLDGVSKEVCQSLVPMTQYLPQLTEQKVNGVVDMSGANCGDENSLVWLFETQTGGENNETVVAAFEYEAPNPPGPCKVEIKNFGKLKGRYYFKYVSGLYYYNCGSKASNFRVFAYADDENLGHINDFPNMAANTNADYVQEKLDNATPNYFTFDGTKNIRLIFSDDTCADNCGSVKLELRKVPHTAK